MKGQSPHKSSLQVMADLISGTFQSKQNRIILIGLLSIFILSGLFTIFLAIYLFEPQWIPLFKTPTSTPPCVGSTLQLGTTTLRFESIGRAADGSVNVPAGTSGVAYWIEDLENKHVFALSPTSDNLTLVGTLQGGEEAIITWNNCNSAKYILSVPKPGEPTMEMLTDQTASGMIVYVPDISLAPGVIVQGEQVEETFKPFETAEPGAFVVDAEVSLLETSASPDGRTIQVSISILNFGSAPFTVSDSDILLIPEDAAPLKLVQSEPSLPQEIKPGESNTFILDFPHPASATAILRIFTIEFDLEDF